MREAITVPKSIDEWMHEKARSCPADQGTSGIGKAELATEQRIVQQAARGEPIGSDHRQADRGNCNRRVAAQLVDGNGANSVPNSPATIARLAGRNLQR